MKNSVNTMPWCPPYTSETLETRKRLFNGKPQGYYADTSPSQESACYKLADLLKKSKLFPVLPCPEVILMMNEGIQCFDEYIKKKKSEELSQEKDIIRFSISKNEINYLKYNLPAKYNTEEYKKLLFENDYEFLFLLRILRARKFNVDNAFNMAKEEIEWRLSSQNIILIPLSFRIKLWLDYTLLFNSEEQKFVNFYNKKLFSVILSPYEYFKFKNSSNMYSIPLELLKFYYPASKKKKNETSIIEEEVLDDSKEISDEDLRLLKLLHSSLPAWIQGFDKESRPVAYRHFGHFEINKLVTTGSGGYFSSSSNTTPSKITNIDNIVQYHAYENEMMMRMLSYISLKTKKNIETFVMIIDAEGWQLKLATNEAYSFIKGMINVDSNIYYERLATLIIVNAPKMLSFAWKLISGWLDETTRAKISIVSPSSNPATCKQRKALIDLIGEENLPKKYGGKAQDQDMDNILSDMYNLYFENFDFSGMLYPAKSQIQSDIQKVNSSLTHHNEIGDSAPQTPVPPTKNLKQNIVLETPDHFSNDNIIFPQNVEEIQPTTQEVENKQSTRPTLFIDTNIDTNVGYKLRTKTSSKAMEPPLSPSTLTLYPPNSPIQDNVCQTGEMPIYREEIVVNDGNCACTIC